MTPKEYRKHMRDHITAEQFECLSDETLRTTPIPELYRHLLANINNEIIHTNKSSQGFPHIRLIHTLPPQIVAKMFLAQYNFTVVPKNRAAKCEKIGNLFVYDTDGSGLYVYAGHLVGRILNKTIPSHTYDELGSVCYYIREEAPHKPLTPPDQMVATKYGVFNCKTHEISDFSPEYVFLEYSYLPTGEPLDTNELNALVRKFMNEFFPQFVWDLLPFTFLYGIYKCWFLDYYPHNRVQTEDEFVDQLLKSLTDDDPFYCNGKDKRHLAVNKIRKSEYLMDYYTIYKMLPDSPLYGDRNYIKRHGLPKLSQHSSLCGLLRKPCNNP